MGDSEHVAMSLIEAGVAAKLKLMFSLCCKQASLELSTKLQRLRAALLDKVTHSLKILSQSNQTTFSCLADLIDVFSLFFKHEAHFNAMLYQTYENQGSESTDSNDEEVVERQSEAEVIRRELLYTMRMVLGTIQITESEHGSD